MYCNHRLIKPSAPSAGCERFLPCIGLRAARPLLDLSFMRSLCYPLLPLALACASPSFAGPLELGEVQVRSEESSELDLARARMNEVPGASNVIDLNTVETGRTGSNTDVLAYQPGVYAQSAGNDGAKVSVRGSGLNRVPGAHGSGLYVMFDGLPLTGPGGTPYELFEPLWLSRAEVLRGANGFDAGHWLWAARSTTSPIPATTPPRCKCGMRQAVTAIKSARSVRGKYWAILITTFP